jgi:hypothetical protein
LIIVVWESVPTRVSGKATNSPDSDHIGQIFQVDLMNNAGHGWNDAEVGKEIHLNGVVNHQVHRHERVDLLRVAAQAGDGGAHGRQIYYRRDAGETLHDDTRRQEGDTGLRPPTCSPF